MKNVKSQRELWVKDTFQTNPLSLLPGGVAVTVVFTNNFSYNLHKVKNPVKYISVISRINKQIVDVYFRNILVWNRNEGWEKKYLQIMMKKHLSVGNKKVRLK